MNPILDSAAKAGDGQADTMAFLEVNQFDGIRGRSRPTTLPVRNLAEKALPLGIGLDPLKECRTPTRGRRSFSILLFGLRAIRLRLERPERIWQQGALRWRADEFSSMTKFPMGMEFSVPQLAANRNRILEHPGVAPGS